MFRSGFGNDEDLAEYVSQRSAIQEPGHHPSGSTPAEVLKFARMDRVENVMMPCLEAIDLPERCRPALGKDCVEKSLI